MNACESPMISEMLCVPSAAGQALLEMHLKQRILADDPMFYSRERWVKHTFFVRAADRIVKFEVLARVAVLPAQVSLIDLREIAQEEIEPHKHPAGEGIVETDPGYQKLVCEVARRIGARFARDGVKVLGFGL